METAAKRAGIPYWNVRGPKTSYRPGDITPGAWGGAQARVFFSGRNELGTSMRVMEESLCRSNGIPYGASHCLGVQDGRRTFPWAFCSVRCTVGCLLSDLADKPKAVGQYPANSWIRLVTFCQDCPSLRLFAKVTVPPVGSGPAMQLMVWSIQIVRAEVRTMATRASDGLVRGNPSDRVAGTNRETSVRCHCFP